MFTLKMFWLIGIVTYIQLLYYGTEAETCSCAITATTSTAHISLSTITVPSTADFDTAAKRTEDQSTTVPSTADVDTRTPSAADQNTTDQSTAATSTTTTSTADNNITDNNITDNNITDNSIAENSTTATSTTTTSTTTTSTATTSTADNNITDNNITDNNITDNNITDNSIAENSTTATSTTTTSTTTTSTATTSTADNNITDNNITDNNITDNSIAENSTTATSTTTTSTTTTSTADNNITDNNITDNNITDNNITDNNITDNNITDNSIAENSTTATSTTTTSTTTTSTATTSTADNNITDNNITDNNITDNSTAENSTTTTSTTTTSTTTTSTADNNITDNNITDNNITDNNITDNSTLCNNITDNNRSDNNKTDNSTADICTTDSGTAASSTEDPSATAFKLYRKKRRILSRRSAASVNENGFLGSDGECVCENATNDGNKSFVTPTNDNIIVLSRDSVPVKVQLVVRIGKKFNPSLRDTTSTIYKYYKKEFKTKLEDKYKAVHNFLRVDVYGFRSGSTLCDYGVILKPGSVIAANSKESVGLQKQTDALNSISILNSTATSQNRTIVSVFQALYKDNACYGTDCGKGYDCGGVAGVDVYCRHTCETSNICENGGECSFDDRNEVKICRCKSDSQFLYSGVHCEIKSERFALSKTYIIAIAAGAGGGVLLILVIVIIVLVVKRKRGQTEKRRDDESNHFKSVSMDDLRFDRMNDSRSSNGFFHRPRIHASENQYQSGLPETKYVDGREHKVMKDERGKETYLYQPSDHKHQSRRSTTESSYSSNSKGPSVYDYIDTDSKFEIQRPNIRLGYMNKY